MMVLKEGLPILPSTAISYSWIMVREGEGAAGDRPRRT